MRVLPADVSARWRSWVGSILDGAVDLCFGLGHRLLAVRERIDPTDAQLTPERGERILSGVLAAIAEPPPFHPSATDRAAAVEHRAAHRTGRA